MHLCLSVKGVGRAGGVALTHQLGIACAAQQSTEPCIAPKPPDGTPGSVQFIAVVASHVEAKNTANADKLTCSFAALHLLIQLTKITLPSKAA